MDHPVSDHPPDRASNRTAALLAQLRAITLPSDFLARQPLQAVDSDVHLERFVFEGPHGGGDPIRIALFAGIHGDEQAGAQALVRVAQELAREPSLGDRKSTRLK